MNSRQFHFGGVANAGPSHLNTICAIGRELQARGHRFTLFGMPSQRSDCAKRGIPFRELFQADSKPTSRRSAGGDGMAVFRATVEYMKTMAAAFCEKAPSAFEHSQIDMLVHDQEEPGAATAADLAGVPYVTVCSSLPLNEDPIVPPSFVSWSASSTLTNRMKNGLAYRVRNLAVRGVNEILNRYRRPRGLAPYRTPDDSFSGLAHFTQLVEEFDFPRSRFPPNFHYVGPFQRGSDTAPVFDWQQLDGRRLVYLSLGTTQGHRTGILRQLVEGCSKLPIQLVVSLGGSNPTDEHRHFPGNPVIVPFAPQRQLLARSAATITHGGLNTAMEALAFGVPMVVIPIAGDQLGVAARARYHGVGLTLDRNKLTAAAISRAVSTALQDAAMRKAADRIKRAIERTGGSAQVAELIESIAARQSATGGRAFESTSRRG